MVKLFISENGEGAMLMYNFTKPLEAHLGTAFDEYRAMVYLKSIDEKRYGNLKRKDKPDLHDAASSLGIEVTKAVEEAQLEIDGLSKYYFYGDSDRQKARAKEQMEKKGATVFESGLVSVPGIDSFNLIYDAFERKLKKLNTYTPCANFELFVISHIWASDSMIIQALMRFNQFQANSDYKFKKVFVCVPEHVYIIDLEIEHINMIDIKDNQYAWDCQARVMAENEGKYD